MSKTPQTNDNSISEKIYLLREKRVMLDFDLAKLYGVETKQLKRQVRRNIARFSEDFIFQLSRQELEILRSQIGTSSWGGLRYLPYAFTEQGVAMLSTVLSSEAAIQVSIQIIRVFTHIRELLSTHKDILFKLEQLEKQLLHHDKRLNKTEDEIQIIFSALKQLLNPPSESRKKIGYEIGK